MHVFCIAVHAALASAPSTRLPPKPRTASASASAPSTELPSASHSLGLGSSTRPRTASASALPLGLGLSSQHRAPFGTKLPRHSAPVSFLADTLAPRHSASASGLFPSALGLSLGPVATRAPLGFGLGPASTRCQPLPSASDFSLSLQAPVGLGSDPTAPSASDPHGPLGLGPPRSPRPRSSAVPSASDLQVSPRCGPPVLGDHHVGNYLSATATYRSSL